MKEGLTDDYILEKPQEIQQGPALLDQRKLAAFEKRL